MEKEYRIHLTKKEWEYVKNALEEYIDKYNLNDPNPLLFEEDEEMAECAINALEVINNKLESI